MTEKEAIEKLKETQDSYLKDELDLAIAIETVLNLIQTKQKEIEELKDKNKTLESLLQGNLYEMYKYYKDLSSKYQGSCISKQKIKDKIDEYKNILKKCNNKKDLNRIKSLNERILAYKELL